MLHADLGAGGRQVFVAQEVVHPGVGRDHLGGQHVPPERGQAGTFDLRNGIRKGGHRCPQHAVLGGLDHVSGELRDGLLDHRPSLHHAGSNACAQVGDGAVGQHREARHPCEEILVVTGLAKRLHALAGTKLGKQRAVIVELIDRQHPSRETQAGQVVFPIADEDVVTQAVLAGQVIAVDGADALQVVPIQGFLLGSILGREEIRNLVVVAQIADRGGEDRVAAQLCLEPLIQHGGELLGCGCGIRRRGRLCGRLGDRFRCRSGCAGDPEQAQAEDDRADQGADMRVHAGGRSGFKVAGALHTGDRCAWGESRGRATTTARRRPHILRTSLFASAVAVGGLRGHQPIPWSAMP